jgi:hypothetical protein
MAGCELPQDGTLTGTPPAAADRRFCLVHDFRGNSDPAAEFDS